jgi:hypothetical protein
MMTSEQENGNHPTTIDVQEVEEVQKLNISVEPGSLFQMPSSSGNLMSGYVKETADKVLGFLGMFPDYLTEAYTEYQKPITTIGLVVVAGLTIAVADGILDRLNTIPLFAPTFELVGLGFTGWFIFRYLLYAASRQELKQEIDVVKNRIVGSLQQHEEKND